MAFYRNWIGVLELMPGYLADAACWREDGVFIAITGLHLSVFNAAIVETPGVLSVARIDRLAQLFSSRGLPHSIQVFSPEPVFSAEALLEAQGYARIFCDPLRIREGPLAAHPINAAIAVTVVESEAERQEFSHVVTRSFDLLPSAEALIALMLRLREGYHVLAWQDGIAVGAGTLIEASGVAGVYNVATMPWARRKGVAAAIMRTLHGYALARGYSGTALAASEMGLPLYDRLGYRAEGYQIAYAPDGVYV